MSATKPRALSGIPPLSSPDALSTAALGAALARQCRSGDAILLRGDLGTGKTTFARGFIHALCPDAGEIVSPTFSLVQTYPLPGGGMLWHFDLYRLRHEEELAEIGLSEALAQGITLIEWPEMAENALPADALDITIAMGPSADQRLFTFTGAQDVWQARLANIKEATGS